MTVAKLIYNIKYAAIYVFFLILRLFWFSVLLFYQAKISGVLKDY